jgi:cob(I)alamin adenosyltransferase
MGVSTKKGDTGSTGLLGGERVPKFHLRIESGGAVDEANSLLGLARATSGDRRIKRIILQVQKHLFSIGAEISSPSMTAGPLKKAISAKDLNWLDGLVERFEEALALPPGFVAFGQEQSASQLDVARTSIRKAERLMVKMKEEGLIQNLYLLKYLNRLSDLIFLLACLEEKDRVEKRKIGQKIFAFKISDPVSRKWAILTAFIFLSLTAVIVLLLIFHRAASKVADTGMQDLYRNMEQMHKEPPRK